MIFTLSPTAALASGASSLGTNRVGGSSAGIRRAVRRSVVAVGAYPEK
jgi:hypothetical protein